jgi:hypothetical protein
VQSTHTDAPPSAAYFPIAQLTHAFVVEPVDPIKLPAAHTLQAKEPAKAWY